VRGEALIVEAVGLQALVQDGGRPEFAHLGVTSSGAADRGAWAAANRLVGNAPGCACIEVVGGGLVVRATGTLLLGVAGAPGTVVVQSAAGRQGSQVDQTAVAHPSGWSFTVFAGETVSIAPPVGGLRTYLGVRGGFDVERTLGSRSTDLLSGLGPPPLEAGDVLPVGGEAGGWPAAEFVLPFAGVAWGATDAVAPVRLAVVRGPRDEWFGDAGWGRLLTGSWRVGAQSNRVGVRLESDGTRSDSGVIARLPGFQGELASEGMVPGAVQVPPDGNPVVFFRDHPVTGGYPVIGVVTARALDLVAQLRPGDPVRFAETSRQLRR
jgi:biotin-dependent carboxylase-like uncharacterized protein